MFPTPFQDLFLVAGISPTQTLVGSMAIHTPSSGDELFTLTHPLCTLAESI